MKYDIISLEEVSTDHFHIVLSFQEPSLPGQFINIKPGSSSAPLLRRPISIFSHRDAKLELIVRKIGPGTELISTSDSSLDILGPLGSPFTLEKNAPVLLVGGGVGNAPLLYLSEKLKDNNCEVDYIYGAAADHFIFAGERFSTICDSFHITTDDGSRGHGGFPTDIMKELIEKKNYARIYTCGPNPLMKKVVEYAPVPVEVSMENYFGCGIGLCAGCTVETDTGFSRACVDGPVYDGSRIVWDSLY
jgi:dihydroorotate dehydrogenase electron transfer subunit